MKLQLEVEPQVQKKAWVTPKLTVHGGVEVITQGQRSGTRLDASFPNGTPFSDLTFS